MRRVPAFGVVAWPGRSSALRQTTLTGLVIVVAIAVVVFPQTREPIDPAKAGPADGWETGSLESVGIDRAGIEAMTASIRDNPSRNIHAVLIERNGRLVYEEYFAGQDEKWGEALGRIEFTRENRHDLRSVTKSIVSALVGIAMDKKVMPGLDTPLVELFPGIQMCRHPSGVESPYATR